MSPEAKLSHQSSIPLPDEPLIVIGPGKSWIAVSPRDLWPYRELFYFLIWRDLKLRYKQTVLGAGWVIMQPLLTTLIFTVFLGKLVRVPSDNVPYPLFAYAGLLPWTFFASAVTYSGNSLIGSSHLITKVYFPRVIIPGAAIGARLVDFAVAFTLLLGLMVIYGIKPTWSLVALPLLILLLTLLTLGLGMWSAALNVKYRDIGIALPVLIQLWMFVSPVVYPASLVPAKWRWIYALNPMVGIIEGFRASVFGLQAEFQPLVISTIVTLGLLIYSAYIFKRMEKDFADLV